MDHFCLRSCKRELAGYFWETKSPRGVICLLHGIGDHCMRFEHNAEEFNERGFSVFSFDMQGHGNSPGTFGFIGKRYEILSDIDTLINIASVHCPDSPIFLFGHSMGGTLALYYRLVKDHPRVLAYIANSPWIILGDSPSTAKLAAYYLAKRTFPKHKILDAVDPEDFAVDPAVREKYLKDPLVHPYISPMTAIDRLADATEILENADAKRKPVYLMHGSDDRICSPKGSRRFAKKAGNMCEYREIQGLRHESLNEPCYKELIGDICEWLKQFCHVPAENI
ncbi:MAG: lysophospholipase [Clostridiales bacterium]|nr:lysophospholipase [Clostridiales bacterium]